LIVIQKSIINIQNPNLNFNFKNYRLLKEKASPKTG